MLSRTSCIACAFGQAPSRYRLHDNNLSHITLSLVKRDPPESERAQCQEYSAMGISAFDESEDRIRYGQGAIYSAALEQGFPEK